MSPQLMKVLTEVRADMKLYPRAFTSRTATEWFLNRSPFIRRALMTDWAGMNCRKGTRA